MPSDLDLLPWTEDDEDEFDTNSAGPTALPAPPLIPQLAARVPSLPPSMLLLVDAWEDDDEPTPSRCPTDLAPPPSSGS